jgi:hypothetical protein
MAQYKAFEASMNKVDEAWDHELRASYEAWEGARGLHQVKMKAL